MVGKNTSNSFKILLSFLKIGTIGFGGGSALIPVIEKELVQDQKVISDQDYLKHTVVANITPGALPVKLGATCGYQLTGTVGALSGAYAVAFPGVLFTIAFMALFSVLGEGIINYFNYASIGITAFIVFLLISYVIKTVKTGKKEINLLICMAAFGLTGGKELRQVLSQILNIDVKEFGTPLFDISTINLIIIAFIVILLLEKLRSKFELIIVFVICTIYAFFVGKTGRELGISSYGSMILLLMLAMLVLAFVLRRSKPDNKNKIQLNKSDLITAATFILVPFLLAIAIQFSIPMSSGHNVMDFLAKVSSSTITSFGGGEAYVSVADGIFVQGGYIEPDKFYTRLVPVANSLPGPILVKIAAGIGYLFGEQASGAAAGWAVAVVSAVTAVGVCSSLAILVMSLYDSVKQLEFISNLKKYILPVICGMLLSTSFAMLFESMKITGEKGIPGIVSLPIILLAIVGIHLLHKKFHLHDVILLLLAAASSLVILIII